MNVISTVKRKKASWIGYILHRNCLQIHVIEGKIERSVEVTGRRRRRSKQLLDDLEEARGYRKFKAEALDHTLWRTPCGIGCGPFKCITTFSFTHETHFCECPDSTPTGMLHVKTTGMS
jgi:hypothetical protein